MLVWLLLTLNVGCALSDPAPITAWDVLDEKLPYPLFEMACSVYNNTVYIFGGKSDKNGGKNTVLALINNKWMDIDNLPFEMVCANTPSIQIDSKIYFIGCRNDSEQIGRFIMYDINTKKVNTSITDIPKNVYANCVVINDDKTKIFVIGGYSNKLQDYVSWLQIYDITKNEWDVNATSLNHARGWFACCYSKPQISIFVFGGHDNDNHLSSIEQYDIMKNEWIIIDTKLNQNISDLSALNIGDSVYIIGGETQPSNPLNDVLQFEVDGNQLLIDRNANLSRSAADMCLLEINDTMWVIAGYDAQSPSANNILVSSRLGLTFP